MKTDNGDQQPDILDTLEQVQFNTFLNHIKREQKNMNMSIFKEVFGYKTLDEMLQTLYNLKSVDNYNQEAFSIENIVNFGNEFREIPGVDKSKKKKILKTVSKTDDFNLSEQKQRGQDLKILTPSQMLSRLPISLPGDNSEKFENEIRQLFHFLCRSKKLQNKYIKI